MTPYDFSLLYKPKGITGIPQNTEEWFNARRGRITASKRAHTIITGRDQTLLNMMEDMSCEMLEAAVEGFSNRYTEHGHAFEEQAINEYQMMRLDGGEIKKAPGMFIHPLFDIASATPDFFDGELVTGQIKCPYHQHNHYRLLHWGVAPREHTAGHPKYYTQVQFESFVTCRPKIAFVSYHPDVPAVDQVYIEYIEKDQAMHDLFTEKLEWIHHMLVNTDARAALQDYLDEKKTVKGIDGIPDIF